MVLIAAEEQLRTANTCGRYSQCYGAIPPPVKDDYPDEGNDVETHVDCGGDYNGYHVSRVWGEGGGGEREEGEEGEREEGRGRRGEGGEREERRERRGRGKRYRNKEGE